MASIRLPRAALVAISLFGLAGCSSYTDRVTATCQRLGGEVGTPAFSHCIDREEAIDQQDRAMWGGVMVGGAGMMQQPRPVYLIEQ